MYADIGLQSSIEESEQIDGDNIFPGRFALQSSIEESELILHLRPLPHPPPGYNRP